MLLISFWGKLFFKTFLKYGDLVKTMSFAIQMRHKHQNQTAIKKQAAMDFQSTFKRKIQPPKHYQIKKVEAHRCMSIDAWITFDYLRGISKKSEKQAHHFKVQHF